MDGLFSDVRDSQTAVPSTPRIKVVEVEGTNVVLEVVLVDGRGHPVITLHRLCLRPGDTFDLANFTIDLWVHYKE
jgi:hypothetical protein